MPWRGLGQSPRWRWWATPSWEHCSGTWTIWSICWKTLCLDPCLTLLSVQVHGWNLWRGNRQWNLLSRECSENIIHLSFVYVCKNTISTLYLFILTSDGLCSARGLSLDTSILLPPSPRTLSALWTLLHFSPSLPASDIYSVNIYSALTLTLVIFLNIFLLYTNLLMT